jgi:integrative and conjugative element protein (TIGR02256 family)
VRIESSALDALRVFAAAQHPHETGGALVGYYADGHTAVVTDVLGPPPDTEHGRTTLTLGSEGVREHLAAVWPDRYYLGDWHTHPGGTPEPSDTDHATMLETAARPSAKCPEPLSIILGGLPGSYAISATVYNAGRPARLAETTPEAP